MQKNVAGIELMLIRSAQVTLISDNININYEEAGWYLVSPYFVGTLILEIGSME